MVLLPVITVVPSAFEMLANNLTTKFTFYPLPT
jgi:hypothetical protein